MKTSALRPGIPPRRRRGLAVSSIVTAVVVAALSGAVTGCGEPPGTAAARPPVTGVGSGVVGGSTPATATLPGTTPVTAPTSGPVGVPGNSGTPAATGLMVAELTRLGKAHLLVRTTGLPCEAPFLTGFKWSGEDYDVLTKAMSAGAGPAVDPVDAQARGALCYAPGPHRAFNNTTWCCK